MAGSQTAVRVVRLHTIRFVSVEQLRRVARSYRDPDTDEEANVTTRDASVIPLRCPHCKTVGSAIRTDDPSGSGDGHGLSLWWVTKGFRVSADDPQPKKVEFRCTYCDEVAG